MRADGHPAPRRDNHAATESRLSSRLPRPERPGEDSKGNAHFQIGNKMPGDHDQHRDNGDAAAPDGVEIVIEAGLIPLSHKPESVGRM